MKIFDVLAVISVMTLVGCGNYTEEEAARNRETEKRQAEFREQQKKQFAAIKKQYEPRIQSDEEKAIIKRKSVFYYKGLVDTIREIDDGSSDASTVARAAVSRNIDRLTDWKSADLDRFRTDSMTSLKIDRALIELPNQSLLDEATSVVLEMRQKKSSNLESQRRYLEHLRRLAEQEKGA